MRPTRLLGHLLASILATLIIGVVDTSAQAPPDNVSFQAVARDYDGQPLSNRTIGIRLQVRRGDTNGFAVYDERHVVATDDLGHFSVEIGRGSAAGSFSSVDWANGPYFLHADIDVDGSGVWVDLGSQQILSVPYALYSRTSRYSDTAQVALDLGIVLSPRKGGTGSSGIPVDGGVAYGDDSVFKFTLPGRIGEILTSTGANAPSWQALHTLIDSSVVSVLDSLLINDRSFMDSVYRDVSERIVKDTAVLREIMRDTIVRNAIRETVHEVLLDSTLWKRWYRMIRDSLLKDTAFTTPLYVTIRSRLAEDSVFIDALFTNPRFRQRLEQLIDEAIDAKAWSLRGNAGISASNNFLGTRDASDLVIRTDSVERLRVTSTGSVGIGTQTPLSALDVAGGVTFSGSLAPGGSGGIARQVLESNGPGNAPRWTSDLSLRSLDITTTLTVGDTAVFNGPAVFNDTVIMRRNWSLNLKDGYIFVGNASNTAQEYAPGVENSILRIQNGRPQWMPMAPLQESWAVGGNNAPTSPLIGSLTGDLNLVAGGQTRLRLRGADGVVNIGVMAGPAVPGGLNALDGIVVATAGGDLRKASVESVVGHIGGSVIVPPGQTLVTVAHTAVTSQSVIVVTYEDLNDTEFIFCQVVSKTNGSFQIRLSGMPRSNANARINYVVLNP